MSECLRCRNCGQLEPLPKGVEPEPDADRIARRFETVRILRAAFDQWRKELQSKAKTK